MMDIAWLVAVLQPLDVTAHPNLSDWEYDVRGPSQLAARVLGGNWRPRTRGIETPNEDLLTLIDECLRPDTIRQAVPELARQILQGSFSDPAQTTALTLFLACAAAELDDYETIERTIGHALIACKTAPAPESGLLRAALLQQRALRRRDQGVTSVDDALEVRRITELLKLSAAGDFQQGIGVLQAPQETLEQIRQSLAAAALSLLPFTIDAATDPELPSFQVRVRSSDPIGIQRATSRSLETYAEFVDSQFARATLSATRTIGGHAPDLFHGTLALELLGHGRAVEGRRRTAVMRLLSSTADPLEQHEVLRLLRHGGNPKDLDRVLDRVRSSGPLTALGTDARQILKNRVSVGALRQLELKVLDLSADILASSEAAQALDAVEAVLQAGGPENLAGIFEAPITRKEVAWSAAAALGNACADPGRAATIILESALPHLGESVLADLCLVGPLEDIEWELVPDDIRSRWVDALRERHADLPRSTEQLFRRLGLPAPQPTDPSLIDSLIHRIGVQLDDDNRQLTLSDAEVQSIAELLREIRSQAESGSYSFGGRNIPDLAAFLIAFGSATELWAPILEVLTNPLVPRQEKAPALDRLSWTQVSIPEWVTDELRIAADQMLMGRDADPFPAESGPFPAALRFLGTKRLIEEGALVAVLAEMSGAASPRTRLQAAYSISHLASGRPSEVLVPSALLLSSDEDGKVRSHAGKALVLLSGIASGLQAIASARIDELLRSDGVDAPLAVLQALTEVDSSFTRQFGARITQLASDHPSRTVRLKAEQLAALLEREGDSDE